MIPRAISSWQLFVNRFSADVYVHAWDEGTGMVSELIGAFDPIMVCIEKPRQFHMLDQFSERCVHSNPYSVFSMWTSINESMQMVRRRGVGYDRVIRARFDVDFEQFDLLDTHGVIIPGKPAEIYEYQGSRYPGWHDMMAYGDLDSMLVYADTLHKIPSIYSEGSPFFSEFFLSTNLFRTNTNVTHHAVHADIVRS